MNTNASRHLTGTRTRTALIVAAVAAAILSAASGTGGELTPEASATLAEVAFEKEGWSQELFEEFSWRIEALRDGAGGR